MAISSITRKFLHRCQRNVQFTTDQCNKYQGGLATFLAGVSLQRISKSYSNLTVYQISIFRHKDYFAIVKIKFLGTGNIEIVNFAIAISVI